MWSILHYYFFKLNLVLKLLQSNFETSHLFSLKFISCSLEGWFRLSLDYPLSRWNSILFVRFCEYIQLPNLKTRKSVFNLNWFGCRYHKTVLCGFIESCFFRPYFMKELSSRDQVTHSKTWQIFGSLLKKKNCIAFVNTPIYLSEKNYARWSLSIY